MKIMESLANRVTECIAESKMTQKAIAKKIGIAAPSLNNICSGKTKSLHSDTALKLSRVFNVRLAWLTEGELPKRASEPSSQSDVTDIALKGHVPIISAVQAGDYVEVIDNFAVGDPRLEWVPSPIPVRAHTFALRVEGDSMEPDFPQGYILFVEPEASPLPGDYVIAKNGDAATFKQLIRDGNDWYLRPINPRYPVKPLGEATIVGVVKFSGKFL